RSRRRQRVRPSTGLLVRRRHRGHQPALLQRHGTLVPAEPEHGVLSGEAKTDRGRAAFAARPLCFCPKIVSDTFSSKKVSHTFFQTSTLQRFCSRSFLTRARNAPEYAPSTARWSNDCARMPTGRIAIESPSGASITIGFLRTPSVDRIATCGWLMIGAVISVPNEPLFEIVYVPPARSSGFRRP